MFASQFVVNIFYYKAIKNEDWYVFIYQVNMDPTCACAPTIVTYLSVEWDEFQKAKTCIDHSAAYNWCFVMKTKYCPNL